MRCVQRCMYKLEDCTLKKIVPMPDSKFLAPFSCSARFLAPNHDSSPIIIIILAIHSLAKYNFSATAHARIFQNAGKSALFFEIRCHCSSPSSLYIHRWLCLIHCADVENIKRFDKLTQLASVLLLVIRNWICIRKKSITSFHGYLTVNRENPIP